MPTDETGERRQSHMRRAVMQHLLSAIEQADGMTPKELVIALRSIQLTQAKHIHEDETRAIVSDALAIAADRIEAIAT